MSAVHYYTATITWTGNLGEGTSGYLGYHRTWDMVNPGQAYCKVLDRPFVERDPLLYNTEYMLFSALSACHMLWYLHLASDTGIIVEHHCDAPLAQGELF